MSEADAPNFPPAFQRLASANLAAQSAEQIALAAAPIVAVLMLGAGAGETGVLAFAQSLPFLLLAFPAGVLADRTSRRRLMMAAEALRALTMFAVPVLILAGQVSIPLLAALGFAATTATIAFSVAVPSLIPALVPRERLAAANGRVELARSLAYAAGPALAGVLVGWLGAPPAFLVTGFLSVAAIVLIAGIEEPARPAPAPRHFLRDLKEGAQFALGHEMLRPILLTAVAWNTGWFVLAAAYAPYAVEVLGLDARGIGLTLAGYGIGMVFSAVFAQKIIAAMPFGVAIIFGPVLSFAAAALMALTLVFPSAALAALAYVTIGVGALIWVVTTQTLRQTLAPAGMIGRLSAIFIMATAGARPLGAAIGAMVGAAFGPGPCIVVALAFFGAQLVIILLSPVRGLKALPQGA